MAACQLMLGESWYPFSFTCVVKLGLECRFLLVLAGV